MIRFQTPAEVAAALPSVVTHLARRGLIAYPTETVYGFGSVTAAAVPGLPLADTVKETDAAGQVIRTVPRDHLVAVQTPQAFPRAMLEAAHQRARSDAVAGAATDDAALCERLGHPVRVVAGSARNIKITTAEDFALAEAMAVETTA